MVGGEVEKKNDNVDGAEKEGNYTQELLVSRPVLNLRIGLAGRHRS